MLYLEQKTIVPQYAIRDGIVNVSWPGLESVSAAGQVLLAAGDWAACRCYADAAERPPQELYNGLLEYIQAADVSVVNYECASEKGTPFVKEGVILAGTAASCKALKSAGFDAACLANNHAMDYCAPGLVETLRLAGEAGLPCFGAGTNAAEAFKPVIMHSGGLRIGLVGIAEPEDGEPDPQSSGIASAYNANMLDHVRAAKEQCDVVVVIVHGGREYVPVPSLYWYDRVMAIAAAGADAVIGHHPHVPQGATVLQMKDGRSVPVFFSVGNFVFRPALPRKNEIPPHTGDGYLVRLRFDGNKISAADLIPYGIDGGDGVKRLEGGKLDDFVVFMRELSADLNDRKRVAEWFDAVVDFQWERHYRDRFATFTRRMLDGDDDAVRFVRNHHHSPAHMTLIDRALERIQHGTAGNADAAIRQKLDDWFEGRWPCGALGRPIGD